MLFSKLCIFEFYLFQCERFKHVLHSCIGSRLNVDKVLPLFFPSDTFPIFTLICVVIGSEKSGEKVPCFSSVSGSIIYAYYKCMCQNSPILIFKLKIVLVAGKERYFIPNPLAEKNICIFSVLIATIISLSTATLVPVAILIFHRN